MIYGGAVLDKLGVTFEKLLTPCDLDSDGSVP
jgi:hypothetical protein